MTIFDNEGVVSHRASAIGMANMRVEAWDARGISALPAALDTTSNDGRFSLLLNTEAFAQLGSGPPEALYYRVYDEHGYEVLNTAKEGPQWRLAHRLSSTQLLVDDDFELQVDGTLLNTATGPIANARIRLFARTLASHEGEPAGHLSADTAKAGSQVNDSGAAFAAHENITTAVDVVLGSASSNEQGRYRLRAHISETPALTLVLRASDEAGAILAQTSRPFQQALATAESESRAHTRQLRLDLYQGEGRWPGPSELDDLLMQVARQLPDRGAALAQLDDSAVQLLAESCPGAQEQLSALIPSARLAAATGLPLALFYGCARHGLAATLDILFAASQGARQAAYSAAIAANTVKPPSRSSAPRLLEQLTGHLVDDALRRRPDATSITLPDLLRSARLPSPLHRPFAIHLANCGGPPCLWLALTNATAFSRPQIDSLKASVQIAQLVEGYQPLLSILTDFHKDRPHTGPRQLAALTHEDWLQLLQLADASYPLPASLDGVTRADKLDRFAQRLIDTLQRRYPDEALRRVALEHADVSTPAREATSAATRRFLESHPGFNILQTNLHDVNRSRSLGNAQQQATKSELAKIQRLARLATTPSEFRALLAAGFSSARQVAQTSNSLLRARLPQRSRDDVSHLKARATRQSQQAQRWLLAQQPYDKSRRRLRSWPTTRSLPESAPPTPNAVHYLQALFLLLGKDESGISPYQVLVERRPSLAEAPLHASHSTHKLPSIALDNEVLANAVLRLSRGRPTSPPHLPTNAENSALGPAEQQRVDDVLANAQWPLSLPFSKPLAAVRCFFEDVGYRRIDFLRAFAGVTVLDKDQLIGEQLGLSAANVQRLTESGANKPASEQPAVDEQNKQDATTEAERSVQYLIEFARDSGLSAVELVQLQRFPGVLTNRENQPPISDFTLTRMACLGRLQRAMHWPFPALGRALHILNSPITDTETLAKLATLERLRVALALTPAEACLLWGDFDIQQPNGLYYERFLNPPRPSGWPPQRSPFHLDQKTGELSNAENNTIQQHLPAIAAALHSDVKTLRQLIAALQQQPHKPLVVNPLHPDANALSVSNLSVLMRHVMVAKAVDCTPATLCELLALAGSATTPFDATNPRSSEDFLLLLEQQRSSGFSIEELTALYRPKPRPTSYNDTSSRPSAKTAVATGLTWLVKALDEHPQLYPLSRRPYRSARAETVATLLAPHLALSLPQTTALLQQYLGSHRQDGGAIIDDWIGDSGPRTHETRRSSYLQIRKTAALLVGFGIQHEDMAALFHRYNKPTPGLIDIDAFFGKNQKSTDAFRAWRDLADIMLFRAQSVPGGPNLSRVLTSLSTRDAVHQIGAYTGWPSEGVSLLVGPRGFNADGDHVAANLRKLTRAHQAIAKLSIDVATALSWLSPPTSQQLNQIELAWYERLSPHNEPLRDTTPQQALACDQRNAMLAYLSPRLVPGAFTPIHELCDALLIDRPQTNSPTQPSPNSYYHPKTISRTDHAIVATQRFVQRILLGKEQHHADPAFNLSPDEIDSASWAAHRTYRSWRRRVEHALFPANRCIPSKPNHPTPLFIEFEKQLRAAPLTDITIKRAYSRYLDELEEVSNLQVVAVQSSTSTSSPDTTLVIGRTAWAPHRYFERVLRFNAEEQNRRPSWGAWRPIEQDIHGEHHLLFSQRGRVYLVWSRHLSEGSNERDIKVAFFISERHGDEWSAARRVLHTLTLSPTTTNGPSTNPRRDTDSPLSNTPFDYKLALHHEREQQTIRCYRRAPQIKTTASTCRTKWRECAPLRVTNGRLISLVNSHDSPNGHDDAAVSQSLTPANHTIAESPYTSILPGLLLRRIDGTPLTACFPRERPSSNAQRLSFFTMDDTDSYVATSPKSAALVLPQTTARYSETPTANQRARTTLGDAARPYQLFYCSHPWVGVFRKRLNSDGVAGLINRDTQTLSLDEPNKPGSHFAQHYRTATNADPHAIHHGIGFAPYDSFGAYHWEIFLHAPLLIAKQLQQQRNHQAAQHWYHFVFDPTKSINLPHQERVWQSMPLRQRAMEVAGDKHLTKPLPSRDTPTPSIVPSTSSYPPTSAASASTESSATAAQQSNEKARCDAMMSAIVMDYLDNLLEWTEQLLNAPATNAFDARQTLKLADALLASNAPQSRGDSPSPVIEGSPATRISEESLISAENALPHGLLNRHHSARDQPPFLVSASFLQQRTLNPRMLALRHKAKELWERYHHVNFKRSRFAAEQNSAE